jgi:hypothetical protein
MKGVPNKLFLSCHKTRPQDYVRLLQIFCRANNICLRRLDAFRIDPMGREGISVCSF